MKKLQSLVKIAALSVATVFTLTLPAKAILVNTFEFTDEDGLGSGRVPGETVTGTITFNSLNPGDSATGVAADSVVVDSIPSWLDSTWGDAAGMDIGVNIASLTGTLDNDNTFNISNGVISDSDFFVAFVEDEALELSTFNQINGSVVWDRNPNFNYARDFDSSSLTFSEASASVPFEFSPTLGLFLVGGVFGISRYAKSRKAAKLIDNQ